MRSSFATALITTASLGACTVINPDLLDRADAGGDGDDPADAAAAIDAPMLPALDLVLHYEFEGAGVSVRDSSERVLHGTLSDLAARTDEGRNVRGLALSGDLPPTRYVELPNGILEGVDDFTIAVWVKLNTVAAWARIYDIGNGQPDPINRFMYLTPSGASGIHAASYGGSATNESTLTTGTELPTGVWKHLALTGSGGDRILYIDGFPAQVIEDNPDVPPYEMEPVAPSSWIGRSRFVADPGLDGTIDDFRIYGRVLSATEVADLAWPQRDYSHWRFDGAATDTSANAVQTAPVNGATWTDNGRLGGALDLAGGPAGPAGPHLAMSASPLAGCDEELTISVWINLRSIDAGARIIDLGDEDETVALHLVPSNGDGVEFVLKTPAAELELVTGTELLTTGRWHHVAVTVNTADLGVLYIDGAVAMTATAAGVRPGDLAATDDNLIGKSRSLTHPYLDGSLDELRIACRSYTPDEIRNLSRPKGEP